MRRWLWFVVLVLGLLCTAFTPSSRISVFLVDSASAAPTDPVPADGVRLVIAKTDRRMRIDTGANARRVLTDGEAANILEEMKPLVREERWDDATALGVSRIEAALDRPPPNDRGIMLFLGGVLALGFLGIFVSALSRKSRKTADGFVPVMVPTSPSTSSSCSGSSCGGGASTSW